MCRTPSLKINLTWICLLQTLLFITGVQSGLTRDRNTSYGKDYVIPGKDILTAIGEHHKPILGNSGTIEMLKRKKRAMALKSPRWPGGIVHYQISGDFTLQQKAKIQDAMQEYMKISCLRFQNQAATNMIKFQNSQICKSEIGMMGGTQILGLAPGCRKKETVMHELGHALGLIHEHQRPDRDDHVTINMQNVKDGRSSQFTKYGWNEVEKLDIPFDTHGIMEYGSWPFSKNGRKTIESKDPAKLLGPIRMDEWVTLTYGDAKAINLMYPCQNNCGNVPCPNGFVGKDCKCWCPPKLNGVTYDIC